MPKKMKCLIVVSQKTLDGFFNPEIIAGIAARTELRVETQGPFTQENYAKLLLSYKPEMIITGWGSPQLTKEIYDQCPSVKVVFHSAGGVGGVIAKEVMEAGVLLTNWGETIAPTIAEATLMMTIASLRRVPFFHNLVHFRKGWRPKDVSPEGLFYQKVGIHGFGNISRSLVKMMAPFSCKIETYSPHVPDSILKEYGVNRNTSLEGLYSQNHVVVVLASKTPANFHIVSRKVLAGMKDGSHLILTGRGAVIDFEALTDELKKGRIFAALDVFEEEPLPVDSPLRGLDNCLLIPHWGGPTPDRYIDMGKEILENIDRFLNSQKLINRVDIKMYDLMT